MLRATIHCAGRLPEVTPVPCNQHKPPTFHHRRRPAGSYLSDNVDLAFELDIGRHVLQLDHVIGTNATGHGTQQKTLARQPSNPKAYT